MCLRNVTTQVGDPRNSKQKTAYKWFEVWSSPFHRESGMRLTSPRQHNRWHGSLPDGYQITDENEDNSYGVIFTDSSLQKYTRGFHGFTTRKDARKSDWRRSDDHPRRVLLKLNISEVKHLGEGDGLHGLHATQLAKQVIFRKFTIDLSCRDNLRELKRFKLT